MAHAHLTYEKRESIESLLRIGYSQKEIAQRIDVHPSTISREIARNSYKNQYKASWAQDDAMSRKKRLRGILYHKRTFWRRGLERNPSYGFAPFRIRFYSEDRSIRLFKYQKWKRRYKRFIYHSLNSKQSRTYALYSRKRNHFLENYMRPFRDWAKLWQRGKFRYYRTDPEREKWEGTPGCSKLTYFQYRPKFQAGYWRARFWHFLKKREAEEAQKNQEAIVPPTSSFKIIVYLPLMIRQAGTPMSEKRAALICYAKGSGPPLKISIAAVFVPLFLCPADGCGHFFCSCQQILFLSGSFSRHIFLRPEI